MAERVSRSTVAGGSIARFGAEVSWALFSLVTGVLVARALGPDGKGVVASIGYLVALVSPACAFGLGEAGAILVRGRGVEARTAVAATIAFLLASSAAGALLVFAFVVAQFHSEFTSREGATLAAMVSVPLMACWLTLSVMVEAQGGVVASSVIKVITSVVTAAATAVLVVELNLAIAGAITAAGLGFGVGACLTAGWLWQRGALARPRWDARYLRPALRLGKPIVGSALLIGVAARIDLLFVQILKGSSVAGLYSVALTLGQLVAYGPVALATASFPVATTLDTVVVGEFVERLGRAALAAGAICALALGPMVSTLVPALFGQGFADATTATLLLIPAGVLWGQQWVICRLWAAQGRGSLLVTSAAATLAAMVALDLVLIPLASAEGAAIAALLASVVGIVVTIEGHRRFTGGRPRRAFVPTPRDALPLLRLGRSLVGRLRGA